ncbi:hypothetical protein ACP4OV_012418 [Aristida adscensionis]
MADGEEPLVQESTVGVVSDADPSLCSFRLARMLLPRAHGGPRLPPLPSPPRDPGPVLGGRGLADFKAWAGSPKLWKQWVGKLRPRHESLWREVGILDAILASTYRVRRDEGALLQLAAFWSGDTSTFVFPWGEATITLEDVAALSGLPLVGCYVREGLPDELEKEVGALEAIRVVLNGSKNKKPAYAAWVKRFLDRTPEQDTAAGGGGGGGRTPELVEHGAFLSMWLSRFVFSAPLNVVRSETFPIAIRLARGQSVALAPAALASIYNDLTALKGHLRKKKEPAFTISSPLHILQLWVWEHFPKLRPETSTSPAPELPWAARWHDALKVHGTRYVYRVLMSPKEFEWRPYGSNSFFLQPEVCGRWVHGKDIARSEAMLSFARCLRACELVGMNCIEKYRPHRVARQLGFDQDVPGAVPRQDSRWKKAWDTYNIEAKKITFIIPNDKPGVTVEYAQWWEPYSSACATAIASPAKVKDHHVLASPMKRKLEEISAVNTGKRLHVDTAVTMPPPDAEEDSQDNIPLVERLSVIAKTVCKQYSTECLVKGAHRVLTAQSADSSGLVCASVGAKNAALDKDSAQDLTNSVAVYANIVDESSCGSTTKKALSRSVQEIKDLDIANEENNCRSEYGGVMLSNALQGAVSSVCNETVGSASEVHMLPTREDIVVISDDERDEATSEGPEASTMHVKSSMLATEAFTAREENEESQLVGARNHEQKAHVLNEVVVNSNHGNVVVISDDESDEATSNDDVMHTMCLKSAKMATTGSIFHDQNEEKQLINERNDALESPVLKEVTVQSNHDCEPANILSDRIIRQEPDVLTHAATVQTDVGHLEGPTGEMQEFIVTGEIDNGHKVHGGKIASQNFIEKGNGDMPVSNQELEYHMEESSEVNRKRSDTIIVEDSSEANRKRSGDGERSSRRLLDGNINTKLVSSEVCTKTLYYLSQYDRSKDAWDRDANKTCVDQDFYVPARAVGTMEMVKMASATRQAEIAELKKKIDELMEEILELEAS